MATPLTDTQQEAFLSLASSLEPEALYSDGEVSQAVARQRAIKLHRQWATLERQVGRKVTQDEVWDNCWNARINRHPNFKVTNPQPVTAVIR